MPRSTGDFDPVDGVYDELEKFDASKQPTLKIDASEDRKPRTKEEMEQEARELAALFAD